MSNSRKYKKNKVPKYDRTQYLNNRPNDSYRDAIQETRSINICEIDQCTIETSRLNSSKCWDHRGICGFSGCDSASWGKEEYFPLDRYPNGKDFRYCDFHRGRLRSKRELGAPRGKARPQVTFQEDPINPDAVGKWTIGPSGYYVRYAQTIKGRLITQQQHRVILEEHLGRELVGSENVHHKNGWVIDNRIKNLELFDRAQPIGQRIEDLIDWCVEYLYERDMMVEEWIFPSQSLVGWKAKPHRNIVASALGRPLKWYERVYFADRDKNNFDLSNLELWTSSKPKSYEEYEIILWMRDVFLPDFGFRVVTLDGTPVS